MTDSPIKAFKEAESWLISAKQSLIDADGDDARISVCCAQAIHAIIRANDALSLGFLGHKSTRHDDAAIIFMKIAREGKLPQGADGLKALIANAMRDKSGADYGKKAFSYEDAQRYIEQTEHFIAMVKDSLKI